ncbi:MAG: phosphoribosylanthranilate isomerase [Thermoguttaceae bacterium]
MIIKICGVTTPEMVLQCAEIGADIIGLVHYPSSPRHLAVTQIQEIFSALSTHNTCKTKVALVTATHDIRILYDVIDCRFNYLQIYSNPTPNEKTKLLDFLKIINVSLIEAVRDNEKYNELITRNLDTLQHNTCSPHYVLEMCHGKLPGGNGASWNWHLAKPFCEKFPALLAGGLTPENVADAIRAANPLGVDVSSGVESAPGVKDMEKVKQFIKIVRTTNWTEAGL